MNALEQTVYWATIADIAATTEDGSPARLAKARASGYDLISVLLDVSDVQRWSEG